jgi:hypothetical protein
MLERFNAAAREKVVGPNATTNADDAEAAKLNTRIQANAHMKFSARTTQGKFRTPRSKGK